MAPLREPLVHFKNWHNPQRVLGVQLLDPIGPLYIRLSPWIPSLGDRRMKVE
jgi:hypothetical protein